MKLKVYGTGDFSSKENTHFKLDDYNIDLPRNIFNGSFKHEDVKKLIITHVHPDHYGDFNSLILKRFYGPKIDLYTTRKIFEDIKKISETVLTDFDEDYNLIYFPLESKVNFHELKPGEKYKDGKYTIEVRENIHLVPTIGIKISDGERTFAYSGDTKYDPELIETLYEKRKIDEKRKEDLLGFLWNADFIVHEVGTGNGHTDIKTLESLPEKIKEKLYIAHYPSDIKTNLKKLEAGKIYEI